MKIVFFGTPQPVVQVLASLFANFDVVGVVTGPDHWDVRKKKHIPTPVKAAAQEFIDDVAIRKTYPLKIFTPEKLDTHFQKELAMLQPDFFVVAAYGKILSKSVLEIPVQGALCIHPSLLPKYRGPSPIPQTILDGEKETGTTIIQMDEQADHGPILATNTYPVHPTDTYATLMNHLFKLGADMLPETIRDYADGKIRPEPQDDSHVIFTEKITKNMGYLDIEKLPSIEHIERMIRAYHRWPGVWSKIVIARPQRGEAISKIIKFLPNGIVQMEGKKPQTVKDFLNGYPELKNVIEKIIII
jgi:methionyl-tRNA formyltransferase